VFKRESFGKSAKVLCNFIYVAFSCSEHQADEWLVCVFLLQLRFLLISSYLMSKMVLAMH
jgi:hypothetical protein